MKCINGHDQPQAGARFCIYCGQPLTVASRSSGVAPPGTQHGTSPPGPTQFQPDPRSNVLSPQPQDPRGYVQPQPQFVPPQQHYDQQVQIAVRPIVCGTCDGDPKNLTGKTVVCPECRLLRPLVPGYAVDNSAFAWAADAKAMAALEGIKPLNAAAKAVSEKVGRRWIEVTFNGILLGEKQLPQIYGQAVRAARILGMSHMPDIYLSGDRAWDCLTFGTKSNSFIVIGSALAANFQGVDMLFMLAREMGHCRAGHALWKTVIRFFLGEQGPAKGILAGGIFQAILSPTHLVSGAIEVPLLAWARQAEITADRAGLLAVGSEEVARRVLLSWSLRSSVMFKQINIDAWLQQQNEEEDNYSKLSEITTTSTPYIGPRLKLLSQYAESPELKHYLGVIADSIRRGSPRPQPGDKMLRFKCSTCGAAMKVPRSVLEGKLALPVRCPSSKCGAITRLEKRSKQPTITRPKRPGEEITDAE